MIIAELLIKKNEIVLEIIWVRFLITSEGMVGERVEEAIFDAMRIS